MKKICSILAVALIVICWSGCKKDKVSKDSAGEIPTGSNIPAAFDKPVQINFPAGMAGNKSDYTLVSLSVDANLDNNGSTKVVYNRGYPNIAYLYDKSNNLVMAGFLTDSSATIDVASTAKVLLYFGYGLQFQPVEITKKFVKEIDQLRGVTEWVDTYSQLFAANPLILSDYNLVVPLRNALKNITKHDPVDIRISSASDIQVDAGDVKSGLRLAEDGLGKFSITNSYRRRAHLFLYKTASKDLKGVKKTILESIETGTVADKDVIVDPAGGITSLTGALGAVVEGKGFDFTEVKSGPIELPLNDNESEATYKARIVGPGAPGTLYSTTNKEILKLTRLEIETFALDFFFPTVMEIVGSKQNLKDMKIDIGSGPMEEFIESTELLLKSVPAAYEEIRVNGNYLGAVEKFFAALVEGRLNSLMEPALKAATHQMYLAAEKVYFVPGPDVVAKQIEQKLKILKIMDIGMQAADFLRIGGSILASNQIDEWTVTARASKVSLDPSESAVIPFQQQKLVATIKNLGNTGDTHPYYEWSTTGKYGKLSDTKGHTNQTSFQSADSIVFYNSNASSASLSDTTNIDYVYVTAFMGSTKIGIDTVKIDVKKNRYEMRPSGITLSGREGNKNEVKLYLEKGNGTSEIENNPDFDYKIVWSTAGKFGKLSSPLVVNGKVVTIFNKNYASYECLDKDTKEGVETINARIYIKKKAEKDYKLYDDVTGTIKINNDPKKLILHIPTVELHGDTVRGPFYDWYGRESFGYTCHRANVAIVKPVKDAVSYSLTFYGFKDIVIGAYVRHSWTPTNLRSLYGPPSWVIDRSAGYVATYSWSGRDGGIPGHVDGGGGSGGMAEVIVTLK